VGSGASETQNSADVSVQSGEATEGAAGSLKLSAGPGATGGDALISAGASTGFGSRGGKVSITSGKTSDSPSGEVGLRSAAAVASGEVRIATGTAMAGPSGTVHMRTGDSTGGKFRMLYPVHRVSFPAALMRAPRFTVWVCGHVRGLAAAQ
jgi:hypothetical protein